MTAIIEYIYPFIFSNKSEFSYVLEKAVFLTTYADYPHPNVYPNPNPYHKPNAYPNPNPYPKPYPNPNPNPKLPLTGSASNRFPKH